MIFSFLNVRKKTSATLAGIAIAAMCLWGLSMWQDIPVSELLLMLGALLLMLGAIIVAAFLVVVLYKLMMRGLRGLITQVRKDKRDSVTPTADRDRKDGD